MLADAVDVGVALEALGAIEAILIFDAEIDIEDAILAVEVHAFGATAAAATLVV